MAGVDLKLVDADLLDRMRLVSEAFRPAAPVDRRSLFAGRTEQIADVFAAVAQPGQHAVIYGERGVGKTSLASVSVELLTGARVLTARATCDVSDDFASVWRKALDEIVLHSTTQAVGFGERIESTSRPASELFGVDPITPDAVRRALQRVAQHGQFAVFIDEFDRLRDVESRILFADTIKTLSDRLVGATVFLIGVADSVGELIREHRSIERALVQIHMPRMTPAELAEIATTGITSARMQIAASAVRKVTTLSQGLPHYTQLLTQLAAQAALGRRRVDVTSKDVDFAVGRAIERAQQSIVEAYREATSDASQISPRVLLACALAQEDEFGFFSATDARAALGRIVDKPVGRAAFSQRLAALADDTRHAVLHKHGPSKAPRYRFSDPLLQPYVAMRGVSEGIIRIQDLH